MHTHQSLLRKAGITVVLSALFILQTAPLATFAANYLTLNSFSGTPGTTLTVSGGGWTSQDHILVYFNSVSGSPVASSTATNDGNFSAQVVVPSSAPQGPLSIIAVDAQNQQASNSYYVIPLTPSIQVVAPSHAPFGVVTVRGSGFAPYEVATLSLSTASVQVQTDSAGTFSNATITVPSVPSNLYHITVTGNSSRASAFDYFWIDSLYPSVSPSAYYLLPGQTLSFTGSGFAGNEKVEVRDSQSSTVLSSFTTDASGSFTALGGFALPNTFHGSTRTFTLTGTVSKASASTGMTVGDYFASVSPSVYWTLPGWPVSFSGSGFAPNESISLYVNASTTAITTFTADATGAFTNLGSTPTPYNAGNSTVVYKLVGSSSDAVAQTSVTVGSYYPTISPSAYFVLPSSVITVSGTGFAPHETVVFTTTGSSTSVSTTTDNLGSVSAQITIPYAKGGVTITANGQSSHSTTSVGLTLATLYPTLTPSAYYVFAGDNLNFTANGFAPNEVVQVSAVDAMGTTIGSTTSAQATATGTLSMSGLTVPFGVSGSSLTYTFTGQTSEASTQAVLTLGTRYAYIGSDNYYVTPGTVVHISGSGFAPNKPLQLVSGTGTNATTTNTTTDSSGSITNVPFTIPFGQTGSVVITATGTFAGAEAKTTITLAPFSMQVTPSTWYAPAGTMVTFAGTGFAPNEHVTMKASAGSNSSTLTFVADSNGNLSASSTLPYSSNNSGVAHYTFTGDTTQSPLSIDISLAQLYSSLVSNIYYAQGGTTITLTGTGFGGNEPVTISFDGNVIGSSTTDGTGALSFINTVPYATAGNHTFTATGGLSGSVATSPFTVAPVYSGIQLGSYAGAPGTAIDFIGSGYLPNEPIAITTDRTGNTEVNTFNADPSGNFNNTGYIIPADMTEGNLTLTITGKHSFNSNSIVYYVTGH